LPERQPPVCQWNSLLFLQTISYTELN
jgi:hypothetical protein